MIVPVLNVLSISKDSKTVTLADTTGAYDSPLNEGGYGTPNIDSPPEKVGIIARWWDDTVPYANTVIEDSDIIDDLVSANGALITKVTLGVPSGYFNAGIHHFKYYPFEPIDTVISLTNNSKVVTITSGTGADDFDAAYKAVILMDDTDATMSKVLLIDKSATMSSSQFSVDTAWTGFNVTGYKIMIATEADLKILFTQLAEACIVSKIGAIADRRDCDDTEMQKIMGLIRWKMAGEIKYQKRDYDGAHKLLKYAELECNACGTSNCITCQ